MKKLKESVTGTDFKKLLYWVKGNDLLKENTKINLLRTFTLLYYTGMRLNELTQLTNRDIKNLITTNVLVIKLHKTNKEHKIYFSTEAIKYIKALFIDLEEENEDYKIIRSKGKPFTSPHNITYISQVNKIMKEVLGERYTSHSFRQGLITEMSQKGINPKIIKDFIGHSNLQTTLGYYKVSEKDIKNSLIR